MKYLSFLFLLSFSFISCNQDDICQPVNDKAPDSEIAALQSYIESNSITAVKDSRGFYYNIVVPGSGKSPNICSTVTVNYKGKLTNGTQFDANNGVSFGLSQLIKGWKQGIPLIKPGGKIMLYLPPSLAYGSTGSGSIPPNAILVFEIDLLAVN
jgi:FKBP-type peptidyl-prolyl cis-trans isomerase FkpA